MYKPLLHFKYIIVGISPEILHNSLMLYFYTVFYGKHEDHLDEEALAYFYYCFSIIRLIPSYVKLSLYTSVTVKVSQHFTHVAYVKLKLDHHGSIKKLESVGQEDAGPAVA